MDWYVDWVKSNPLFSAALQFGILGTFGELVSQRIRSKRLAEEGSITVVLFKVLAWALLGIVIKYGFTGMRGFTAGLLEHGLLPSQFAAGIPFAASLSVFTNMFFGPQMMLFHRIEDNIILRRWDFSGITNAWSTLLWFWIPAHTLTFSLPPEFQIGLAALWSIVLGVILGLTAPKSSE